jgi:uncharacterized protein (TIGR02001 family)
MKYLTGLISAGLLAMASMASAGDFTSTVTAVSDYDFRGVSLSSKDPALQASVDFAAGNGFYAGAWASNYDYGDAFDGKLEIDLYAGFAGETGSGLGWDAGLIWYTYPDSSSSATKLKVPDYYEAYGSISYKQFKFKQWYTDDYGDTGFDELYSEISGTFELPSDFSLILHVGYNYGDVFKKSVGEYMDFSVGVTRPVGHFTLGLKVTGTDLSKSDVGLSSGQSWPDEFNPEPRLVFSVATTFPWSSE